MYVFFISWFVWMGIDGRLLDQDKIHFKPQDNRNERRHMWTREQGLKMLLSRYQFQIHRLFGGIKIYDNKQVEDDGVVYLSGEIEQVL
jgi:hypothetical protein